MGGLAPGANRKVSVSECVCVYVRVCVCVCVCVKELCEGPDFLFLSLFLTGQPLTFSHSSPAFCIMGTCN